jgi:hypothetical protein
VNRPPRLSRRGARRLLDGRPAARPREQRLAEFLDTLADRDRAGRADRDAAAENQTDRDAVPSPVLEAFARQAGDAAASRSRAGDLASPARGRRTRSGARAALRSRRIRRALTVKAAVVLALSGATVAAAAAADALPEPAQRAAYEWLGSLGVPAPGPHHPDPAARPGAPATTARPGGVIRGPGTSGGVGPGRHRRVPGPGSAPTGPDCAAYSGYGGGYGSAGAGLTHALSGGGAGYTYGYSYGANGVGKGNGVGHPCAGTPAGGLPGLGVAGGVAPGPCPSPSPSATPVDPGGIVSPGRPIPVPSPGQSRVHRLHAL